jgi:hypothetical protein
MMYVVVDRIIKYDYSKYLLALIHTLGLDPLHVMVTPSTHHIHN